MLTTLTTVKPTLMTETEDPYIYGWREVARINSEGRRYFHRIPLTLEDILHPQEDDVRMHSHDHEKMCRYLGNVFQKQLSAHDAAIVLADVRIAWATEGIAPHTPDISVVFGVKQVKNWATFSEIQEGTRPTVVVEVTSPSTRHVDLVDKFDEYEAVGVACYALVDCYEQQKRPMQRVLAYRSVAGKFTEVPPHEQGGVWLEPLQLRLAFTDGVLTAYDEHGKPLLDYAAVSLQLDAEIMARQQAEARALEAEARAQAENQARLEAEARAQALEARLRQLESELAHKPG